MKNIILLLLSVLGLSHAMAQNYEYVPFVREGVKWVYSCDNSLAYDNFLPIGTSYFKFEMKGDTIIDGKHYKPVHLYSGEEINEQNDTIPVFLREENKVVYAYIPEGQRYWECPVGIGQIIDIPIEHTHWTWTTGEEHILYDFNDIEGFYDYCESSTDGAVFGFEYVDTDTIQLFNHLSKRHCFKTGHINTYYEYIIESVGFVGSFGMPLTFFYQPTTGFPVGYRLKQVIDHGKVIYNDGDYPFKYEYVPFVREGVKWVYYFKHYHDDGYNDWVTNDYRTLELKGDTIINGKTYKAMHVYSGDVINEQNDSVPVYLREENKVVYGIIPDGRVYSDCPVYGIIDIDQEGTPHTYNGEEFVLYDFQDPVAYWSSIYDYFNSYGGEEPIPYRQLRTDTIAIGGHLAKRYSGEFLREFQLIEGIGQVAVNSTPLYFGLGIVSGAALRYSPVNESNFYLSHVIEDGEIVYKTEWYNEPEPVDSGPLPVVREGVKWVNEKVIVNHGDTTRYYYNYEIRGNDTTWENNEGYEYKACYYYTGEELDVDTDSLIAGLRGSEYSTFFARNHAYHSVNHIILLGMISHATWMYCFHEFEDIDTVYKIEDFYIALQEVNGYHGVYPRDPYLTHENFTEVEPVEIEGKTCRRWSIVGEDGDTLAYLVEGIGFDSRDMGDLLTPFTRRPDPAADHQEWCGLSHVVKDGQIIYKGMRYREDAFEGIGEVVVDKPRVVLDPNYYNLMGQPVGKEVPTTPGIYIHQGKKICVSRIP